MAVTQPDPSPDLVEAIRGVLAKGGYQMPGDALPYLTQAREVAARVGGVLERATWLEATRWSAALGFGDNISEPAAPIDVVTTYFEGLTNDAHEHEECPIWCDAHEWWERKNSCETCYGAGSVNDGIGATARCMACDSPRTGDSIGTDHAEYSFSGTPVGDALAERDRYKQALKRVLLQSDDRVVLDTVREALEGKT